MENAIDQLIVWSKDLKILYVEDDISLREEVSIFLSDIFISFIKRYNYYSFS